MIIAIMNQKGGVGKTTTAVNLAVALKKYFNVLLVDMDPQANASVHLNIRADMSNSMRAVLSDEKKISDIIQKAEGINVAPSHIGLAGIELQIANAVGRELILDEVLTDAALADFHSKGVIIIDSPPSLGLLSINVLTASDKVIVPVSEYFAMEGLSDFLKTVDIVNKKLNKKVDILGFLMTLYTNTLSSKTVFEMLQSHFSDKVFSTKIRANTSLKEAPGAGQSIFQYKKTCHGYEDYEKLGDEIYERIKN
ncbi:MAG: ParA family protein [bacterium]